MEGDWLIIPWVYIPKTPFDKIMDCKGQLPVIWQRVIAHCTGTPSRSGPFCETCRETRCLIYQLHDQLDKWVIELEAESPHLIGVVAGKDARTSTSTRPFRNHSEANLLCRYWETRLVLYSLLWRTGRRPNELCHDGISGDLERWDAVWIASTQALSRDAPFYLGHDSGAFYRDGLISVIHAAGAFCERRGGMGDLGKRVIYIQNHIIERWDADRLSTPILLTDDGTHAVP